MTEGQNRVCDISMNRVQLNTHAAHRILAETVVQDLQVVEQTWQTRRPGEGQMATVPASDPAGSPGLMKLILDSWTPP